ncbi:MATE family efflux transporter [Bacillus fonticola]|uniref:MATE family efflux transporter n=1 Tax=Bacillus fonticola TaxID=2728853 RepID=UPI0014743772|nr:MATE family efflux transporter [Bacillus fonticola]
MKSEEAIPSTANPMRDKVKIALVLALPAVAENFFQTILGFVDTYFVSKIGLVEVTAVGVTNALLAIYFALFMAVGVAVNVMISNSLGAGKVERARHISQQGILLAILLGILSGIVTLFFAEPLLRLMGIEEEVLEVGVVYFRIVAIPSVFMALMFVLGSILRGAGDTNSPMKVSIIINVINAGLDYILIFGFLFIPSLGIVGAALATVVARIVGSLLMFRYIGRNDTIAFRKDFWRIDWGHQKELLQLGSPAAGERLVMRIGQVLYFGFVVALGTNTFAAHQIAGNIEIFSYMIGYGFATAATILVGRQIGAGNIQEAKTYAKICTVITIIGMSFTAILLFVLGEWVGSFFSEDPVVIGEIGTALKTSAVFQPFLAVLLVLTGAFQGANNTKFPMYLTAVGMWAIRTVLVYVLAVQMEWGILGVWIAIGVDIAARAVVLLFVMWKGKWIKSERKDPTHRSHPETLKEKSSRCVNNY